MTEMYALQVDMSTVTVPVKMIIGAGETRAEFSADLAVTKLDAFTSAIEAALIEAGVDLT